MDIKIRRASVTDAEEVNKCLKLAFKEYEREACYNAAKGALSEDVSKTRADIENQVFLVAECAGKIIGSLRVKIEEHDGYLSRFSVLPEYHKYGTGRLLLEQIDKVLQKLGINSVYLHTCLDVVHLIDFYTNAGFRVECVSEDRGYRRAKLRKTYGEKYEK